MSPFTTPAPLAPTMHSPPFPNRSIPPWGAFPRRGPVRVIVPTVSPVVPILLGCPPFVVQFARKSLVKWAKGAVWNRVLVQFARENLGKWAKSAIWSRVFASLCPLRPTFPSCRTSRRSVCCGAAGVALLGVRVQERNLDHTQAPFASSKRNGVHSLHPPAVAPRARYRRPPRGRQWDEVSSFDNFLSKGYVLSMVPHINERLYPYLSGGID